MADSIDWGMLQPLSQMSPIHTASPTANSGSVPSPVSDNSASQLAQQQQIGIEKQKLQMEQQRQGPMLEGLKLDNQGKALTNQQSQMTINSSKYAMQQRQERMQAYAAGKAKGGGEGGLDAMQEKYFEQGDTDSGMKLAENREKLKDRIAKDSTEGLMRSGSIIHGVITAAKPAVPDTKDPRTGQIIPGTPEVTALDNYTKTFPTIHKIDPYAPDPSTFKNNEQFLDTYATPVMSTINPIQQKFALEQKAITEDKLHTAQSVVDDAKNNLRSIIKEKGASSQEAKDAANALQQAQSKASQESVGGGFGGTLNAVKNALPEWAGGTPSTDTLIKQASPQGTPNVPNAPPSQPGALNTLDNTTNPQGQIPTQGKTWTLGPDGKLQ